MAPRGRWKPIFNVFGDSNLDVAYMHHRVACGGAEHSILVFVTHVFVLMLLFVSRTALSCAVCL